MCLTCVVTVTVSSSGKSYIQHNKELNWVEIALQDPLIRPPVKKFGSFAGEIKRCLYAYLTSHHPRMEKLT